MLSSFFIDPKTNNKFDLLLATVLGIGKFKYAPGTLASIIAFLTLIIERDYYLLVYLVLIILTIVSYFSINKLEKEFGNDPSFIVIDEFVAMAAIINFNFINWTFYHYFLAFIFFRIFDIFKPFPINKLNEKSGSFYVIADDLLAGIFTLITLILFNFLKNFIGFLYFL